jgi:hypothetical protein
MTGILRPGARAQTPTVFVASKAISLMLMKDVGGAQSVQRVRRKLIVTNHKAVSEAVVSARLVMGNTPDEETPTHPASVLGDTAQRLPTQSRPITAAAMKAGMVTSISVEPDLVSPPHERTTKGLLESSPPPRQCLAAPLKDHGAMSVLLTTPGNTIDVTAATEIRDHAHNLGIAMVDPIEPNTSTRILGTT